MFEMVILIFIVFWSEKKVQKEKSLLLEVTIDTFVGCPLFHCSVLPPQLYFWNNFPGIPDLEDFSKIWIIFEKP